MSDRRAPYPPANGYSPDGVPNGKIHGWNSSIDSLPGGMIRREHVQGVINALRTRKYKMLIRRSPVANGKTRDSVVILTESDPPNEDWFSDPLSEGVRQIAFLSELEDGGMVLTDLRERSVRLIIESDAAKDLVTRLKKHFKGYLRVPRSWRASTYGYPALVLFLVGATLGTISVSMEHVDKETSKALDAAGQTFAALATALLLPTLFVTGVGYFLGAGMRAQPTWAEWTVMRLNLHGWRLQFLTASTRDRLGLIAITALITSAIGWIFVH